MQDDIGKFTKQEILSQPDTWVETLKFLKNNGGEKNLPALGDYDQVILTGCGSTYYFSIWASRFLQASLGIPCMALPSSEIWYSGDSWIKPYEKTLLIAVSRSGRTTETLHALDFYLQSKKGDAVAVTCYADSPLAKKAPTAFTTKAGMENSITQTRSFTNMMWPIINLVSNGISDDLINRIGESSRHLIEQNQALIQLIGDDLGIERFFFLGDGAYYGLSQEVMLKMKEMSLSYSESFHFLEFRHGPMSMVNDKSLIVGFCDPKLADYELPIFRDMKKLGGRTLAIGKFDKAPSSVDYVINLDPGIPDLWLHPFYLPLIQLIAYRRSISKGLNPDKPENLTAVVEL